MTIKELIQRLQTIPEQDQEMIVCRADYGFSEWPTNSQVKAIYTEKDNRLKKEVLVLN